MACFILNLSLSVFYFVRECVPGVREAENWDMMRAGNIYRKSQRTTTREDSPLPFVVAWKDGTRTHADVRKLWRSMITLASQQKYIKNLDDDGDGIVVFSASKVVNKLFCC